MRFADLPSGWLNIKLGDVVEYGKTKKCELSDVFEDTWILELEDIEKDSSKIVQRINVKARPFKSTKNKFKKGDVLYGKLRPYLNKVVVADQDGVCSTEIIPLNAEPSVNNRYLYHWLKSETFLNYVIEVSYGVNMPRLGTQDGLSAPLIVAPLAEQKVIADKLDILLAQVESTKSRLERIPKILKTFRQSVLAAAVSGKLTEKWRFKFNEVFEKYSSNDYELSEFRGRSLRFLPKNWQWLGFEKVASIASNLVDPFDNLNAIHVAPNHIESWTGVLSGFQTIEQDGVTSAKHQFQKGQILYSKIRPYLAKVTIAEFDGLCSADMYPINSLINKKYLYYWMLTSEFTDWVSNAESRSVLPKINQKDLSKIPVPTPPLEEQTEIVCRIEQLFAFADSIEQKANAALARVNNLTQSILAKAFRGELTADWRAANPDLITGENSAAALLEKIKAEREAMQPKKKTKTKA